MFAECCGRPLFSYLVNCVTICRFVCVWNICAYFLVSFFFFWSDRINVRCSRDAHKVHCTTGPTGFASPSNRIGNLLIQLKLLFNFIAIAIIVLPSKAATNLIISHFVFTEHCLQTVDSVNLIALKRQSAIFFLLHYHFGSRHNLALHHLNFTNSPQWARCTIIGGCHCNNIETVTT